MNLICPLAPHQLATPLEHGLRLEDASDIAQLLDGLSCCIFQFDGQYSEGELFRSRHIQRLTHFPLDESELSPQQEALEILDPICLVTRQVKLDQWRNELGKHEPAHRPPKRADC
jgi:hypothetical protein